MKDFRKWYRLILTPMQILTWVSPVQFDRLCQQQWTHILVLFLYSLQASRTPNKNRLQSIQIFNWEWVWIQHFWMIGDQLITFNSTENRFGRLMPNIYQLLQFRYQKIRFVELLPLDERWWHPIWPSPFSHIFAPHSRQAASWFWCSTNRTMDKTHILLVN